MSAKPKVKMIGEDGNSFAIIGRCRRAAAEAGMVHSGEWDKIMAEMMKGDYDHLLQTVTKHFKVDAEEEEG